MDTVGNKGEKAGDSHEESGGTNRALKVLDRAIQGFGAAGISTIYRLLNIGQMHGR